jgi:hypothetical protein
MRYGNRRRPTRASSGFRSDLTGTPRSLGDTTSSSATTPSVRVSHGGVEAVALCAVAGGVEDADGAASVTHDSVPFFSIGRP